jgi:NADPH-dependent glutamate synthase beta subunit-like oxidoreductase
LRMHPTESGRFLEVKLGFTEEMAVAEAKRCLKCQLRLQIEPVTSPPLR